MKNPWQELRYGIRTLWARPVLSAVVVLTIAFGIGANTAIFGVVNRVLLNSSPLPESEGAVASGFVGFVNPRSGEDEFSLVSSADFLDWDARPDLSAKPEDGIGN